MDAAKAHLLVGEPAEYHQMSDKNIEEIVKELDEEDESLSAAKHCLQDQVHDSEE